MPAESRTAGGRANAAKRRRRGSRSALTAGEAAGRLLTLCDATIAFRAGGWCAGAPHARDISVGAHGVVFTASGLARAARPGAMRRHRAHLRGGHDDACAALGVSRRFVGQMLAVWEGDGVRDLLLEAFDAAVAELVLDAQRGAWSPVSAGEAITHAIGMRITPRR